MKAVTHLPEGYVEIYSVDLQKNKKVALFINAFALVIVAAMAVPALFFVPISTLFDMESGLGAYMLRSAVLAFGTVAYIILHELVHGLTMKLFGTKKVKYGFTGMYAFAGSDDHYGKTAYIAIALAPIAVWGIVLAIINLLVPAQWFWVVYIIQITNISGAAGDLFVTARFLRMPADILVRDCGVGMKVYSKTK